MHNSSHIDGRLKWEDAQIGRRIVFLGYPNPELYLRFAGTICYVTYRSPVDPIIKITSTNGFLESSTWNVAFFRPYAIILVHNIPELVGIVNAKLISSAR